MKPLIVPAKTRRKQSDVEKSQCQQRIHYTYIGITQFREINGVDNLCNETEMRYVDGRKPDRKFTSPPRKLRALAVRVPHRIKPKATVIKPAFNGVYVNTKGAHSGTSILSHKCIRQT